jgi:hypothetical protein
LGQHKGAGQSLLQNVADSVVNYYFKVRKQKGKTMNTKHNLLLIFLLLFTVSSVFADVGIWDRFETSITNTKSYADPYRDTTPNITYTRPDGSKIQFWGFYDGGTTWTIRFMPDMLGSWKYSATFSDGQPGKSGSFNCVPSDLPGMISQDEVNPIWFGYKGGNHMIMRSFHVGDRFFAANWPTSSRKAFLDYAQKQGYNTLSIGSHYLNRDDDTRGRGWDTPDFWDNASRKLKEAEYDEMEVILNDLERRRIIVFPFAGFLGANSDYPNNSSDRTLYFKYTLARLGPYWNVMLNVAGPELSKWKLSESEVTTIGKEIQSLDVFGHLLACHQTSNKNFFKNQSWNNYDCYQGTKTHDLNKLYTELSKTFRSSGEPFYAQETLWSGNKYHPNYSDTQLRKNAIVINMTASAFNFGDMNGNSSTGFTGSLDLADRRQSRHDIVKNVWDYFETIEFWKMSPRPDLTSAGYCLAKAGEEYLIYRPSRGSITVDITGGPYNVTWINAQNTSERINGGITTNGQNLSTPGHGDDWFYHLTQDKTDPTPTPTRAPGMFILADGLPTPRRSSTPEPRFRATSTLSIMISNHIAKEGAGRVKNIPDRASQTALSRTQMPPKTTPFSRENLYNPKGRYLSISQKYPSRK